MHLLLLTCMFCTGVIDFDEFTVWYVKSEMRLKVEMNRAFEEMDTDNNGYVDAAELRALLGHMHVSVSDEDVSPK